MRARARKPRRAADADVTESRRGGAKTSARSRRPRNRALTRRLNSERSTVRFAIIGWNPEFSGRDRIETDRCTELFGTPEIGIGEEQNRLSLDPPRAYFTTSAEARQGDSSPQHCDDTDDSGIRRFDARTPIPGDPQRVARQDTATPREIDQDPRT